MKSLKSRGYTLVELIIVFFILGVVFQLVASTVDFSTTFIREESSQVDAQENLRILNVMVEKDIRKVVLTLPNDFIELGVSGNQRCYQIGTATVITYCFGLVTHNVTRNGSVVSTDIGDFILSSDGVSIRFEVQTIPDQRNAINESDVRIYIRTGEVG